MTYLGLPARSSFSLAYDGARQSLVLFGGWTPGHQLMADTWEWTAGHWRRAHPAHSPSPREISAMVYDPARRVTVLYGGRATLPKTPNTDRVTDTWTWDGGDWTQMHPDHVPNLFEPLLTYDVTQHQAVLFGGFERETWTWDGVDWTQRASFPELPNRGGTLQAALGYDEARSRVVLFGGFNQGAGKLDDTWELDRGGWTRRTPFAAPPARSNGSLCFDASRGRLILVGGDVAPDAWTWDGETWQSLKLPARQPMIWATAACESASGRMLALGSADNPAMHLFEWRDAAWHQLD
jgi:hypothetical protein